MPFLIRTTANLLFLLVNENNVETTCRTKLQCDQDDPEEAVISFSQGHFVFLLIVQVETGLNKMPIL